MENLRKLLQILYNEENSHNISYYIPYKWNEFGYKNYIEDENRKGEIRVNPYDYFIYCIENIIDHGAFADKKADFDIKESIIYSMLPRAFTAWNHGEDEKITPGTFLKSIAMIPYLKELGVDVIYLLPIFQCSQRYKKGEIGSPYAIKNFYKIDENLHDDLLGEYSKEMLDIEFASFVEACHAYGIFVMVDFVFRTASRDNDLMVDHPDWFYWIDKKYDSEFKAPTVGNGDVLYVNDESIDMLYKSDKIDDYIGMFRQSPKEINPAKWKKIVEIHKETGKNILDLIEKDFGITTVPGFPDVINDKQPPWTDVTYLRLYFDSHKKAKEYIRDDQPPYIMQDGASLHLYHGEHKNSELWNYIKGVIPYYQSNFKIDGARIDMGHALSEELNKEIISSIKEEDQNFILWSEEFDIKKSSAAKMDGYDFISGYLFSSYKKIEGPNFNKDLIEDTLKKTCLPLIGAPEMPDTPRASLIYEEKAKLKQIILINYFLPNTIPFINNGLEIGEIQPMNLGLDNTEDGRFVLPKCDPMYGKLAFFDNYRFHWIDTSKDWLLDVLKDASIIRNKYIHIMSGNSNVYTTPECLDKIKLTTLVYFNECNKEVFFIIANRDFKRHTLIKINDVFHEKVLDGFKEVSIEYKSCSMKDEKYTVDDSIQLAPGDVVIGHIG